jgi:hypothetical protein
MQVRWSPKAAENLSNIHAAVSSALKMCFNFSMHLVASNVHEEGLCFTKTWRRSRKI